METITTKRLKLRRMAETDLPDFLDYQNHPNILSYLSEDPITEEHALRFLAQQAVAELTDQRCGITLAVHHLEDDKIIGHIMLSLWAKVLNQGEIGFVIHPDYQRKGYAVEGVEAILNYCFTQRELHRMIAKCDIRNTASMRVMERLGMRREAHFKKSILIRDQWQDEYLYAILEEEWNGLNPL